MGMSAARPEAKEKEFSGLAFALFIVHGILILSALFLNAHSSQHFVFPHEAEPLPCFCSLFLRWNCNSVGTSAAQPEVNEK